MFNKTSSFYALLAIAGTVVMRGCLCGLDMGDSNGDGCSPAECGDGICSPPYESKSDCPQDCFCGDRVVHTADGEECDGSNYGGMTCGTFDCTGGWLSCNSDCTLNTSYCTGCDVVCGNGVAEEGEWCDGQDLKGETCLTLGCQSGSLYCSNCRYDLHNCSDCPAVCGDGVRTGDEECEESDLGGLTCRDMGCHSGTLRCNNQCELDTLACIGCGQVCGDGLVDSLEECDCGTDPDTLPAGCTAPNGHPLGECRSDCQPWPLCYHHVWEPGGCTPSDIFEWCCPDAWGNDAICLDGFEGNMAYCVVECATTDDCHYNNYCQSGSDGCLPNWCRINGQGEPLFGPCLAPDGNTGICIPYGPAQEDNGICVETGSLADDAACTAPRSLIVTFPRDLWGLELCSGGLCVDPDGNGDGTCATVCDWQDVYDNDTNDAVCGTGYNCVAASVIDPLDPNLETRGLRSADLGYCLPTAFTDPQGITSCDLLTGELIWYRDQRCTNQNPDLYCLPMSFSDPFGGPASWGSLMGSCQPVAAATPLGVWDPCDATSNFCGTGASCFAEDTFSATPMGVSRCVPFCDTQDASPCTAQHPQVPATNLCTSLSAYFRPGPGPGTTDDASPTRLGLCACPPQGCP